MATGDEERELKIGDTVYLKGVEGPAMTVVVFDHNAKLERIVICGWFTTNREYREQGFLHKMLTRRRPIYITDKEGAQRL